MRPERYALITTVSSAQVEGACRRLDPNLVRVGIYMRFKDSAAHKANQLYLYGCMRSVRRPFPRR